MPATELAMLGDQVPTAPQAKPARRAPLERSEHLVLPEPAARQEAPALVGRADLVPEGPVLQEPQEALALVDQARQEVQVPQEDPRLAVHPEPAARQEAPALVGRADLVPVARVLVDQARQVPEGPVLQEPQVRQVPTALEPPEPLELALVVRVDPELMRQRFRQEHQWRSQR